MKKAAALFLLLCLARPAWAGFVPLPTGARAAGLAEAFTATADDAFAVVYNPAGLVHLTRPEITTHFNRIFSGFEDGSSLDQTFFAYAQPLPAKKGKHAHAMGLSYAHAGSTLYEESAVSLAYGREVFKNWNAGLTLKSLKREYGSTPETADALNVDTGARAGAKDPLLAKGDSAGAIGADLGLQARLSRNYALGAALRNINQPDVAVGSDDKAPMIFTLGLGRWTRSVHLALEAGAWRNESSYDSRMSFSGERWFSNGVGLRSGLAVGTRQYTRLALGLAFRARYFQVDYAPSFPLQGMEETLGSHLVTLTVRFGAPPEDPLERQIALERENRQKAEQELIRMRQLLLEMTSGERKIISTETQEVEDASRQAMEEAGGAWEDPAALLPPEPAPKPKPKPKPAKPGVDPAVMKAYSEALKFYAQQTKDGAAVSERKATLRRILEKYQKSGISMSTVRAELKKLESDDARVNEDFSLAVEYYHRVAAQGLAVDDKIILLQRIISKYRPLGVDTRGVERELADLQKQKSDVPSLAPVRWAGGGSGVLLAAPAAVSPSPIPPPAAPSPAAPRAPGVSAAPAARAQSIGLGNVEMTQVRPRVITPNDDGWNDKVLFEFANPAFLPITGEIFDINGAKVSDLIAGPVPDESLVWDGKRNGEPVPGGVYVYEVTADGQTAHGTVVVAR